MSTNLFVLDSMGTIEKSIENDSSTDLIIEGLNRGEEIYICEMDDIFAKGASIKISAQKVNSVDYKKGYGLESMGEVGCDRPVLDGAGFDMIWLRKNPPFDLKYLSHLHILEVLADQKPDIVWVNHPRAILEWNEKLTILEFSEYIVDTIVTSDIQQIKDFFDKYEKIVLKGLHGFASNDILLVDNFEIQNGEIEEFLKKENNFVMAQRFIEEIYQGDKRVNIVNSGVLPPLVKLPPEGSFLTATRLGSEVKTTELTDHESELVQKVIKFCKKENIMWAGIDIIGGYLSEFNITSPSFLAKANRELGLNQEKQFWDLV